MKHYLMVTVLFLLPVLAYAQAEGITYTDDNPKIVDGNGNNLTFTVTEKTNGLENLVDAIQNPLNGVINDVVNDLSGLPLLNLLGLPAILAELTGIGSQTLDIDLGTIYTATINGPNGTTLTGPNGSFTPAAWTGMLTIPTTVYNSTEFSEDNLLKLALDNNAISAGALGDLVNLRLDEDINLGILEYLLDINLGGASGTPGIPVTAIGNSAFKNSTTISPIDMSAATNLVSIGNNAFQATTLTGYINLENCTNLATIGTYAFYNCTKLTGISFPIGNTLTSIGSNAFASCKGFTGNLDLSMLAGLTEIADDCFNGCSGYNMQDGSSRLILPPNITRIGSNSFSSCGFGGSTLKIPSTVEVINDGAFYNDGFTGDLIIPKATTTIMNTAFQASNFRTVTFEGPKTLDMANTSFGDGVFQGNGNLEYIDMSACTLGTVPTTKQLDKFSDTSTPSCPWRDTGTHTVVYLPKDDAAGTLATLLKGLSTNVNTVYTNNAGTSTCDWFYVAENNDYYLPHGFKAARATYGLPLNGRMSLPGASRNNFYKLNTVYLPFDFKLTDNTNFRGYSLQKKLESGDLRFEQLAANDEFKANTPYILRYVGGDVYFPEQGDKVNYTIDVPATQDTGVSRLGKITTISNGSYIIYDYLGDDARVNVNGGSVIDPVNGSIWSFYGTTETIDNTVVSGWNAYNFQSGKDAAGITNAWHLITSNSAGYVKPFRAFFAGSNLPANSKPVFKMELENTDGSIITGIGSINNGQLMMNNSIYTIAGQYVGKDFNALPKGIYVVNGKKIIK